MGNRLTDVAWDACEIVCAPTPDRIVLQYLCKCAHDDGTHCFPSIPTIMAKTGLSKRRVQYSIDYFGDLGWVETLEPGNGRRHADYKISLPPTLLHEWDRKHRRKEALDAAKKRAAAQKQQHVVEHVAKHQGMPEVSITIPDDEEVAY